ncbi:MAG TPA: hypothetical protein VKS80_10410 [Trinickia sp.]|nr:hypothetical protein [Trinickia sp.]
MGAPEPALPAPPQALAQAHAFRGTIAYRARRDGAAASTIVKGLAIVNASWSFDERSDAYDLHADPSGASIAFSDDVAQIDDVFAADPTANAYVLALAQTGGLPLRSLGAQTAWESPGAVAWYVDPSGAEIAGIEDRRDGSNVGFTFSDWTIVDGLALPQHVLRLRDGRPDKTFSISQYVVTVGSAAPSTGTVPALTPVSLDAASDASTLFGGAAPASQGVLLRFEFVGLGCIVLVGAFVLLWARRDLLVSNVCRRMARDPRGWRRAGVSIFVGPDGALTMDGLKYRVGPHFFSRAALVQTSLLFIRVSAPGTPRCVILPRKFRPVDVGLRRAASTKTSAGFTLVETIVATALFTAVIMLGIYPALLALSRADAMAQQRLQAASIAANALADEQAAAEYGGAAPQGSTVTQVDGFTLRVVVSAGGLRGSSALEISVSDATGAELAHVESLLGPPVPAPPKSSGGPPGG